MDKVARDYERFRENVPKILEQQLLNSLASQFLDGGKDLSNVEEEHQSPEYCAPSVCRYYAALLFIDISGFTVLSQRLPVDELRLHINGYFKRIIDITDSFGGDVVKFAGDALFVVWPVEHNNGGTLCLNLNLFHLLFSYSSHFIDQMSMRTT
jgi:class 3 adenylate cyclase